MAMKKPLYLFALITSLLLLAGCNGEEKITDIDNPEKITIAFFNAIYNEKDIDKATSVCTENLARVIRHYRSPNAVARHMFNMSYDKVEITPDDSGIKVREQFKDKAVITVYFTGTYNGDIHKNVKRLSLIQVGDRWLIDKILKDPF